MIDKNNFNPPGGFTLAAIRPDYLCFHDFDKKESVEIIKQNGGFMVNRFTVQEKEKKMAQRNIEVGAAETIDGAVSKAEEFMGRG